MAIRTPPVDSDKLYKIEVTYSRGKDSDSSSEYFYGSMERAKQRQCGMIGYILGDWESVDLSGAQITSEITLVKGVEIIVNKTTDWDKLG